MTETITVRPGQPADVPAIVTTIDEAGFDEAVFSWVIPDEQARRERLATGAEQQTAWVTSTLATAEIVTAGTPSREIAGVAVWQFEDGEPETAPADLTDFFAQAYGPYAARMMLVLELTGQRHPRHEPHWYLQQILVVPALRGHGLGGALLRHQLARADAAGVPAYLEASSPRNRALYERYGFQPLGDSIALPEDGPRLQPMWRPLRIGRAPAYRLSGSTDVVVGS
ncbi:GNAT family N-acetyltransferase [Micromonospora polyrhachis]|uniref:GNAT superfamily N-acetyltransferase n=1 Tax=Micromonospora polyrhachis TaxID=1282883 RepID=A0A7W7SMK3_9ACTN|nr:GNAT family N-acetyltransferase [Micromonospora polyrhachis]MBB4957396.1 GNAT superfamily N-acetyltransferase [Micromonospora polyrhachis]